MTDQTADRAAAPVKQRADCTETEWAEQERARFERLYTRETVRADTAARDAEIYQGRLKRLGEGYTKQRQRAEQAEAEAERLRTDRAATCICEHTEAQHFEDACLACDCGDYLVPEAAREVIARWRAAATRAPADRAAVLDEAERTMLTYALDQAQERIWSEDGFTDEDQAAVDSLRRLVTEKPVPCSARPCNPAAGELCDTHARIKYHAQGEHAFCGNECDEEAQPAEARPSLTEWVVETLWRDGDWRSYYPARNTRDEAHREYENAVRRDADHAYRLTCATTTYAVEAEHQPAAGAQQPKETGRG